MLLAFYTRRLPVEVIPAVLDVSNNDGALVFIFHFKFHAVANRNRVGGRNVVELENPFHPGVPDSYIEDVLEIISACPRHTFQILTKRAERLADFFGDRLAPDNAWLGVSVEDQKYGIPRIDALREVQASIRFLSAEPLLECLGEIDLSNIHWVIVGGESGQNARPMKPQWVENIQRQCQEQGAQFFFKQWGGWGADGKRRSKKANGRQLNGRTWDEMPDLRAYA